MNANHPKASHWIANGIFDRLGTFEEFEARVNRLAEEKDRGDAFEIFVEAYLATQPITQRVKHWVVGSVPLPLRERYRLPSDGTGIDGIYEVHDGTHVAYQVKYRRSGRLSFAEVAPFLGITEKFTDRVIFTNAATLSDKVNVRSRWVSGDVFRSLPASAFASIEEWLKEKPQPVRRLDPDPRYQTQALADIKAALCSHDRGTVVMACGTGKTLVALWAAEQAGAQKGSCPGAFAHVDEPDADGVEPADILGGPVQLHLCVLGPDCRPERRRPQHSSTTTSVNCACCAAA